jgi:methanogenic corrinoid protein MtbC1
MADLSRLKTAMGDLEEDSMEGILQDVLKGGNGAQEALAACQEGMSIVGDRFESGEYFVGDLIYAGNLMNRAVEILKPLLVENSMNVKGRVILCTVRGDLHDIGKSIVKAMLEAGGFEVVDLGIDVAPEKIVAELQKTGIKILALSAVLTIGINSMKATVDALATAGIRDKVKVIIGGAPVTESYFKTVGADAWSLNPMEGVKICKEWTLKI